MAHIIIVFILELLSLQSIYADDADKKAAYCLKRASILLKNQR